MTDEQELFVIDYPQRRPEQVWGALRRALGTVGLTSPDDETMTAWFSSGVSLTSWGENMVAAVASSGESGARVVVRGRPKASLFTARWGEDIHAQGVERDLRVAVDNALVQTG